MKKIMSCLFSVIIFLSCGAAFARDCKVPCPTDCSTRCDKVCPDITKYVVVTPEVCDALRDICDKFEICGMVCPKVEEMMRAIKRGEMVVSCDDICEVVRVARTCDPKNPVLKKYQCDMNADARCTPCPKGPESTKFVLCPPFATCPTAPPNCVFDPNQSFIPNIGAVCLQACEALIENLWVSGCVFFKDCAELIFTAQEFGAMFDECTGIIQSETGVAFPTPPYRLNAAFDVFVDGINETGDCPGQLVVRTMPPSNLTTRPAPYVCFCVPADFDSNGPDVEFDICFVVPAGNAPSGVIEFNVCHEFVNDGTADFIFPDGSGQVSTETNAVPVANATTATFNHYTATACIPASDVAALDIGRIAFERTAPGSPEFDFPVYITSVTFRYPRVQCLLPVNGGNCPTGP